LVATALNPVRQIQTEARAFVFDIPATALPPLPAGYLEDQQIVEAWGYGHGGADANYTFVELVIQGRDAKAVVLTDLVPKVEQRAVPLHGTYVDVIPGAGPVDGRNAQVDLDKPSPRLEDMVFVGIGKQSWSFPLRVSESEPEVIYLWVRTERCDCQWFLELHFVADGKHGVVEITNDGKLFRTASSANSTPYTIKDGKLTPGF